MKNGRVMPLTRAEITAAYKARHAPIPLTAKERKAKKEIQLEKRRLADKIRKRKKKEEKNEKKDREESDGVEPA